MRKIDNSITIIGDHTQKLLYNTLKTYVGKLEL
jgi:hypothetical protein